MKAKPAASNRPVRRAPKPGRNHPKLRRPRDLDAGAPAKGRDKRTTRAPRDSGPAPGRTRMRLPLYETAAVESPAKAPTCAACGLCCSYVAIEVDAPSTVKRATQLLWYLYHDGVSLYENGDEWMVQFEANCRHLQPDHRCGIYATRPHICREFSEQDCEMNSGDDGHTFYTPGEFLGHVKQQRPRVHALLMKGFAPPQEPMRVTLTPFERRMQAVRSRRAALGV